MNWGGTKSSGHYYISVPLLADQNHCKLSHTIAIAIKLDSASLNSSSSSSNQAEMETELRLCPPGTEDNCRKRSSPEKAQIVGCPSGSEDGCRKRSSSEKAQIVGWPPIRSFRKSRLPEKKTAMESFVKVGMDGAPYLRKIDLGAHHGYSHLRDSLISMFRCSSLGFSGEDDEICPEFAIAYEDKDGDLMLAGDVPWEMFASSCKRLRIMRRAEVHGRSPSS
ncbi:auxin-responsive protein IAA31-like [Wolffia australiana]